jgi:hypothetical protein
MQLEILNSCSMSPRLQVIIAFENLLSFKLKSQFIKITSYNTTNLMQNIPKNSGESASIFSTGIIKASNKSMRGLIICEDTNSKFYIIKINPSIAPFSYKKESLA